LKKYFLLFFIILNGLLFSNSIDENKVSLENSLNDFPKLYEKTVNSILWIKVYYDSDLDKNYSFLSKIIYGRDYKHLGSGSGFVFTDDGYILTNYHVIKDANVFKLQFYDETEIEAELIGFDDRTDIAVLKINKDNLSSLKLDNDEIKIGQWVYTVGNPYSLTYSFSVGIISAKNRNSENLFEIEDYYQIDGNMNPGHSGSPVLNLNGSVIGIINSGINFSGIGFVIPNSIVNKITTQILKNGKIKQGRFGFAVDKNFDNQFVVSKVIKNSSAQINDIVVGDEIIEYDGIEIKSLIAFKNYLALKDVEEDLYLKIKRNDEILEIVLTKQELKK
jgi:serine protease Do